MGSESFNKKERLLKKWEYQKVFDKGWRINKRFFIIYGIRKVQGFTRIGISVPKRVGSAIKRNKIKRLIREVFRRNKDRFIQSHDIVIVAKDGAEGLSFKDIEKILLLTIESGINVDTDYQYKQ
ncbi:MAG: ribonuclease P protein component [Nitrospinota bacterium]